MNNDNLNATPTPTPTPTNYDTLQGLTFSEMKKPKKVFNKLYILPPVILVLIILILMAYFMLQNNNLEPEQNYTIDNIEEQLDKVAEDKNISNLSDEDTVSLKSLKTIFYKPVSNIFEVNVTNSSFQDKIELMTYGIGTKSDSVLGRVSVTQFAKPELFNPPENCGPYLPGGLKSNNILSCRQVVENDKFTGFAYEGPSSGIDYVSPDGQQASKLTLYAEFNGTVIIIQGVGVSSDSIISYMSSMTPFEFEDYPADTTVFINVAE